MSIVTVISGCLQGHDDMRPLRPRFDDRCYEPVAYRSARNFRELQDVATLLIHTDDALKTAEPVHRTKHTGDIEHIHVTQIRCAHRLDLTHTSDSIRGRRALAIRVRRVTGRLNPRNGNVRIGELRERIGERAQVHAHPYISSPVLFTALRTDAFNGLLSLPGSSPAAMADAASPTVAPVMVRPSFLHLRSSTVAALSSGSVIPAIVAWISATASRPTPSSTSKAVSPPSLTFFTPPANCLTHSALCSATVGSMKGRGGIPRAGAPKFWMVAT